MLGLYRNTESVKPIQINQLVDDTLMLLGRQLESANIQVIKELGELPETVASMDQLSQVFSNLLINARDAMGQGGILRLRTRLAKSSDDPHPWIQILVADSGSGIPREMHQSIFEPFVSTKGEKGTGLGLWIVKGIMSNHAGKISVRSKLGKGTVFKLSLPVLQ
jgi:signal transduction histidine kinase